MAYFKIEQNKKGLVAKINVYTKDIETGKNKIITKRIYNDKNLTESKFEKYVEKFSMDFEEEVQNAYKEKTDLLKSHVLTFEELGKEFIANIKTNLSINYYTRAKDIIAKFNGFLVNVRLNKEPISAIKVRDVQMFLNSYETYQKQSAGTVKLIKDFPKNICWRFLDRENIIPRSLSYDLRHHRKHISKTKAQQICAFCNLNYDEYFKDIDTSQRYSTETIKGYRRVLRTVFNEALRYDWISKNPVCQTKVGAGSGNTSLRPIHEKEVFSIEETKRFINALDNSEEDLMAKKLSLNL